MMKYVFFNEYGNVIYEECFNSDDAAAKFCDEVDAEYFCDENNF